MAYTKISELAERIRELIIRSGSERERSVQCSPAVMRVRACACAEGSGSQSQTSLRKDLSVNVMARIATAPSVYFAHALFTKGRVVNHVGLCDVQVRQAQGFEAGCPLLHPDPPHCGLQPH